MHYNISNSYLSIDYNQYSYLEERVADTISEGNPNEVFAII